MKFLANLDWFFRTQCQNLLNWLGKKFGVDRRGFTVNSFIGFILCYCWVVRTGGWLGWAMAVLVVVVNFFFLLLFLSNFEKEEGEFINWIQGKGYRWAFIVLTIFLLPVQLWTSKWDLDTFVSLGYQLCQFFFIYIPTCLEAPPKEKKEQRAVAFARY